MRILLGILFTFVFAVFGSSLFAEYDKLNDAKGRLVEVTKAHDKLEKNSQTLEKSIEDLQNNPRAIERVAREKWHYCRTGEKIYYFSSRPDSQ